MARIACVPTDFPGADWRNLPDVSVRLPCGTTTNRLQYGFKDATGRKMVCSCQDTALNTKKRKR